MKRIGINVDIGEGMPYDEELLKYATSANVGCGAHCGSPQITMEAIKKCRRAGVVVGAHPGYPDPENMGRVEWDLPDNDKTHALYRSLTEQLTPMEGLFAYIKPHGAFYHQTQVPSPHAGLLTALLAIHICPLLGTAGTTHERVAAASGVKLIKEGFGDRRYLPGTRKLAPRSEGNAMLTDPKEIQEQVLELAEDVDSICVHGDSENCVEIIRIVSSALEEAGYEVRS